MARKGYWIAQFEVSDLEAYKAYQAAVVPILRQRGARFLVRGGRSHLGEGQAPSRTVVVEFNDYKSALSCYLSPEYERAKALTEGNAVGSIVVIEGYEGEQ
jgi:uncharacterized protein (DUF1330 family)